MIWYDDITYLPASNILPTYHLKGNSSERVRKSVCPVTLFGVRKYA